MLKFYHVVEVNWVEWTWLTLIMSGVIIFGPEEEKDATSGAGFVCRTVFVREILATGFLQARSTSYHHSMLVPMENELVFKGPYSSI